MKLFFINCCIKVSFISILTTSALCADMFISRGESYENSLIMTPEESNEVLRILTSGVASTQQFREIATVLWGGEASAERYFEDFDDFAHYIQKTITCIAKDEISRTNAIGTLYARLAEYASDAGRIREDPEISASTLKSEATNYVSVFFNHIDNHEYIDAYLMFSKNYKTNVTEEQWVYMMKSSRFFEELSQSGRPQEELFAATPYNKQVFVGVYKRDSKTEDTAWVWLRETLRIEYRDGKWSVADYLFSLDRN